MFKSLHQAASKIQTPQGQGEQNGQAPARQAAQNLAAQGRYGDTQLIHISNSELEQLKKTGRITKNPHTGLPEAFSLGGFVGNVVSSITGGAARDRTNQADTLANTLNDPHRVGSFNNYTDLMNNPQSYFQNNPYAKNALAAGQQLINAQSAKSGNPVNVEATQIPQIMAGIGQNYNNLLQTEQVGAGLNQGAGYSGMAGNAPFGIGQQQIGSLINGGMNLGSSLFGGASGGGGAAGGAGGFSPAEIFAG